MIRLVLEETDVELAGGAVVYLLRGGWPDDSKLIGPAQMRLLAVGSGLIIIMKKTVISGQEQGKADTKKL